MDMEHVGRTDLVDRIAPRAEGGRLYYDLRNRAGKRWLIRDASVRTAFGLYQPTAITGRAIKLAFPVIRHVPGLCGVLGVTKSNRVLMPELRSLFDGLFDDLPGGEVECSIFGGTPGPHRKVVMQLYRGREVLAYCKITDNPAVAELFDAEAGNLRHLHDRGVSRIPRVLACGEVHGLSVFCQSNVSDVKRTTVTLTDRHCAFLTDLRCRTAIRMPFEDTDYHATLLRLRSDAERVDDGRLRDAVLDAIDLVNGWYGGRTVNFGFYHGDFTPWNIADTGEHIAVFDFEYAKRTYPPYLDACHFLMQTWFFVYGRRDADRDPARLVDDYLHDAGMAMLLPDDDARRRTLILYLLSVIGLYLSRGDEDEAERALLECRIEVLRKAVERYAHQR